MAIVEMLKLKMYGASADKQKILDALFETKLVHLKNVDEIENTNIFFDEQKFSDLEQKRARIEKAIANIETKIESLQNKVKIENDIDMSTTDFEKIALKEQEVENVLKQLDELSNRLADIKKERTNLENRISQLVPYVEIKESFSDFKNTKNTSIMLGMISQGGLKEFDLFLKDCPLTVYEVAGAENNIIKVYSHISESFMVTKKLNELGFTKANFELQISASEAIKSCEQRLKELDKEEKEISLKFCEYKDFLKELKVMHDYFKFLMAKEDAENKFRSTSQAFVLEAYLPKDKQNVVDQKLKETSDSIEYEFLKPADDEMPPTITKNNKVVSQFEFVTNMYSAPHYRELDPNSLIALFFSIFFGFIMADIGYGICLVVFGVFMALKQKRQTGFKQLMNVIAVGGVFTIFFGALFGSFFGLSHENWYLVPIATLPNPIDNVITLLVACLAAGVVQIMVSFVLKGILLIKRKRPWEAIFTAFAWDFFFIGLALFVLDFANIYKGLGTVGIIVAVSSVAVSVVGLFIINKGFEKISKSFGALYGIINLFSDILSYARLFGLMLSGAIIASIVNQLAADFLTTVAMFPVGCIILAIGHGFNLAMGALGAYIHVARLQYIEFFSRFYEGEGELFVPFGTDFNYVKLI